jgi:hypothetical protein
MPRRDNFHANVRQALINDGWIITHDPLEIRLGGLRGYIDLAAERPLAAEKAGRKIAVEIKSFIGHSVVKDLEEAVGQYIVYRSLLAQKDPERLLYLAIDEIVFEQTFNDPGGQVIVEDEHIRLVIIRFATAEVLQWIG